MARVLNRAYAALNRVLDLAGSQIVADVDLEQVFAVHDMTPVVQSARVDEATWAVRQAFGAGGGSASLTIRPPVIGDWDRVTRGQELDVTSLPSELDADYLITHMAVAVSALTLTAAQFYTVGAYQQAGSSVEIPITSVLDVDELIGMFGPTSGEPYYYRPMPMPVRWVDSIGVRLTASDTVNADVVLLGYIGPRGSLFRPHPNS